jgi:hypothetical protein
MRNILFFLSSLLLVLTLTSCGNGNNTPEPALAITGFTPNAGVEGTVVTITGTGFSSTPAENTVNFGTAAGTVTAATPTELKVTLPPGQPFASVKISVTRNGKTVESANPFTTGLEILQGEITANKQLLKSRRYLLKGTVLVTNGATLSIEAGTVIKGDKATSGTLVIGRGAKINAVGTAAEPIVFTSNQPKTSRTYGDWGGVILLGRAANNQSLNQGIEGLVTDPRYQFGGTQDDDNSGVMKYVRIEFCGVALSVGNEINGLTLGSVGSGTELDYIQVSFSGDDSFEWFGGMVNARHLIAFRGFDDDFDTDQGYRGKVQFGLGLRDPAIADASQSNGFEADNSVGGTGTPLTAAVFSHITCVGGSRLARGLGNPDGVDNQAYGRGAHLRRNVSQSIYNSVFIGSNLAGISLDGVETQGKYDTGTPEAVELRGNVLAGTRPVSYPARGGDFAFENSTGIGFADPGAVSAQFNAVNLVSASVSSLNVDNLVNVSRLASPVMLPGVGSPLLSGAIYTGKGGDAFFEKVPFRGAFGTTNWAEGWTNFDPGNTDY